MRAWSLVVLVGCAARAAPGRAPAPPAVAGVAPAAPAPISLDDLVPADLIRRPAIDAVAAAAAEAAAADHVVSARALRAAMAAKLGSGLWPHVLTGWGTDAEITAQLRDELAELRITVAIAELGLATAAGRAGRVGVVIAMPPPQLPVELARDGATSRVSLAWPWAAEPAAYGVAPDATWRLDAGAISRTGDRLDVAVDCARPAAIEIWAGIQIVATVVDACGDAVAYEPLGTLDLGPPAHTRVELERRIFELLNRERAAAGLSPLGWDPATLPFARAHAADMARSATVGHAAPDGAQLRQRVDRAGIGFLTARENVGHAWGPGEVSAAFMASPGHRANLLADDVTVGCVGVVLDPVDPHAFYVTEFFRAP